MANIGEQVPHLLKVIEQDQVEKASEKAATVAVKAKADEQVSFSVEAESSEQNGTGNPYRCQCSPGNKCAMHLAVSLLPEARH